MFVLYTALNLTNEEQKVAQKVDSYFKSKEMTLYEKLFNAMLIAQHDLESHNFTNEDERIRIIKFKKILDGLLKKIND